MDATSNKRTLGQSLAQWCNADHWEATLTHFAHASKRPPFWMPLLLLAIGTLLIRGTNIDLAVSALFYDSTAGAWPFLRSQPWDWLYHWGVIPGIAVGVIGLVVYLLSFSVKCLKEHRHASLYLALAVIVGPGLLINGIMKPCWGRPRPCQVEQFGGDTHYVPPFELGHYDDGSSFPSGHASIGFALMAPMFLAFRRHRHLAAAFFMLGMSSGLIMGVTRIVQGRHFLSDVMWSAATVYFTCWLLGAIMQLYAQPEVQAAPTTEQPEEPTVFRFADQPKANEADNEQEHRHRRAA